MPSLFVDMMAAETNGGLSAVAAAVDQTSMQIPGGDDDDESMIDHMTAEMAKFNCYGVSIDSTTTTTNSTCSSSDAGYPDPSDSYLLGMQQQQLVQFSGGLTGRASQNTTECVPVPSSEHVAEIVGRQGCKIKALRAKTNTYIKTPVRGEESVFIVTGRKEDVEAAKLEIFSAADHFTQIRASRRHSQGGIPAPGHITAYVRVPYKFVGLVVGPKGATIKRIQQLTHTYIITPSREKEPIFEVTGLSENVEAARHEIELHIVSRTGVLLQALDDLNLMNKDALLPMVADDFHLNGTETAYDHICGSTDCSCESVDRNVIVPQQQTNNVIRKPLSFCENNNNIQQNGTCACKNSFLCVSQVQTKYGSAWSNGGSGMTSNMNLSGSDQDDGVWSMGGESPSSFNNNVEPLFPSYLSSIWSDLDDPKDVVFQKRSASISMVPETDNKENSWIRAVGNPVNVTPPTSCWSHTTARRLSSAPNVLTTPPTSSSSPPPSSSLTSSALPLCGICGKSSAFQAALMPCDHKFCLVCATRLRQMPPPVVCPTCQTTVTSAVRLPPSA